MKNLTQKIFLIIMLIVLIVFGREIYSEFMAHHTYYNSMFWSWTNWKIVISAIISAWVPILYLIISKEFSLKKFIVYLVSWLLIFSLLHMWIKDGFVWSGFVIFIINNLILFTLWAYFIVWTLALWSWLSKMIIKFKENRIQELFLKFGFGLGAILILTQILMWFGLFHPVVVRIIFLGLSWLIWYMKNQLKEYWDIVSHLLSWMNINNLNKNRWQWIMVILVIFSIIYYFYGFQLSFIPYSTAWDANHEYLYVPKVIAENFGIIRGNVWTASVMPYLRHSFIAFWFSLWRLFGGSWLSPDTIAVSMNFLSGPLVLFFGLALINESIQYFGEKLKLSEMTKSISLGTWWMTLLLWLTSGMWAFLVFVDNKTDLGVMALTILAVLSGFIFIRYIAEHKTNKIIDIESLKYLGMSGFFFALASMAKPTAFIDIVVFAVLLFALWINSFAGLGIWIIALGMMWIVQPANAVDFMWPVMGKWIVIIWLIIAIIWVAQIFIKNSKQELLHKKKLFSYIVIWWVALFASLLVFKWPWMAYRQIINNDFGVSSFAKGLFLSMDTWEVRSEKWEVKSEKWEVKSENWEVKIEKWPPKFRGKEVRSEKNKVLLATTDVEALERQNEIDRNELRSENWEVKSENWEVKSENWEVTTEVSGQGSENWEVNPAVNDGIKIEQCLTTSFTEEELEEGKKEAVVGNEDVGRYVWYGWKTFTDKRFLSYSLLRLFYPKNDTCYGVNSSAKVLCKNKDYINAGDIQKIEEIEALWLLDEWSEAQKLVQKTLVDYKENPSSLRTNIVNLKQYYEDHSIYTEKWKIYMPYRYIVPLNITFNWSLQNLSSYYTDIGFIWMFIFIFTIFGLIYSIIQKDQKLFSLSFATVAGWAVWRVIGGAILWYGIWLIMWTILVVSMFIQDLISKDDNKNNNVLVLITLGILWLWMIVQMFFNLIRISSQGASWPFLWFKQSVGNISEVTNDLRIQSNTKIWYSQKDVFDLQFPHYNKFIEYSKDRDDKDGVLIAGTYLQYFLHNQKNIKFDGMLGWFWEQWSDEDTCKTYHRLRSENLKYLVIDPNIATVVMWEWNESLFHRFFANVDPISNKIVEKGSMIMLAQLIDEWYANLFYSNNLWAKYWFGLSDEELMGTFGNKSKEEITILRAQLAAARFMQNSNDLVAGIGQILNSRVSNGKAIWDIADVFGKVISEAKVINTMNVFLSDPNNVSVMVETLTQDERFVLIQYLNLYTTLQQNNIQQYQEMLNNILMTSLAGGSQLIVFELR